ncbi:MAG: alpha/beta fold hydrolase [Anaerolineae bacterium]|nr:alpha/beta fold hydrolase [Anaerolineae bacterium]
MSLYVHETGIPGASSIVFLHGIGTSGWMWDRQITALAGFHCLTVDLPGHGKSNREPWISLADTAGHIAQVIRVRATNGRAHVVGLSLGGYIALALLEHHTDALDRVVISGVTAAPMPNRALLPLQLGLMSVLLKRRWFVNMQASALHLPPDMQYAFIDNLLAMSMPAYRRIWREGVGFYVPPSLQYVNTPTLITAGSRESNIITHAVGTISTLMPNAHGCLAPGFGHGWNVEAPGLFSAMVRAWITGAPLPAGLQTVHGGSLTVG